MEIDGAVAVVVAVLEDVAPAAVDMMEAALISSMEPEEDADGVDVTTDADDADGSDVLAIEPSLALAFRPCPWPWPWLLLMFMLPLVLLLAFADVAFPVASPEFSSKRFLLDSLQNRARWQ